ncbi:MAG TPA: serine/threonine-protein kinase [Kofleriaceae bacterium]|jgi:serine/threonine-protein kinase
MSSIHPSSIGSGSGSGSGSRRAPPGRTTMTTSADALHEEEVARTRGFLRIGWIVAIAVVAMVLLTPGDPLIAHALIALVGVGVVASAYLFYELRDPSTYKQSKLTALALLCVVCGHLGVLYVGNLSAAPLLTILGLYLFCRTEDLAAATVMLVIAAVPHVVEAVLIITGVMHDPGFYPWRHGVKLEALLAGHGCMLFGYAMAFIMARLGRRASLQAIDDLQDAIRLAAQREEQVQELRQDLDRALKIGGPGRFTSHIVGAWELGNVLGRGAMGEVYLATHTGTGDEAAVKLLRRELLGARDYVERFLREVRAASALDSPHVVRVLDASTPEDPIPFLAMERLHGHSLGDLLRKRAQLSRQRVIQLVTQIASVLEVAATQGLVHRDIKPHNLFLDEQSGEAGFWKLLDFGVAHLGESSGTLTQGAVVGTPTYMAPEQAKGLAVDTRADVYALAAVLYRCVTGQVPFVGRDTPSLLYAVVHVMPLRPGAIASVSPAMEAVLAIGLAKIKEQRFQTAAELAAAVDAADRGELSSNLKQRARAILKASPWTEPVSEETQQLHPVKHVP